MRWNVSPSLTLAREVRLLAATFMAISINAPAVKMPHRNITMRRSPASLAEPPRLSATASRAAGLLACDAAACAGALATAFRAAARLLARGGFTDMSAWYAIDGR